MCNPLFKNTTPKAMAPLHTNDTAGTTAPLRAPSVLAWPAWLRVLALLPALVLLWLAVLWASVGAVPL